ncbi:hypothetical protein DFJ77DRAFT_22683 [Powellomyces hirtus]|nr:hypothetical protein DFJ77DRAFT_22683 [Powellomyces hirtus]
MPSLTSASTASLIHPAAARTSSPPPYQKSDKPARSYLSLKRKQYEYTFGVFMMEPWEKAVFDTMIALVALLGVYAIWHYVPGATSNLMAKASYYMSAH